MTTAPSSSPAAPDPALASPFSGAPALPPALPAGWEMRLRGGEPQALDVCTDYGGRCESARLFFVWREVAGRTVLDPAAYPVPPQLRRCGPDFEIEACPLPDLLVRWQTAALADDGVILRLAVTNRSAERREIELYAISAIRLRAADVALLPPTTPLRIVRDIITGRVAPGLSVAFGLAGSDAFGLRAGWSRLWAEIESGQGLGNIVSQRPARERYAALALSPVLRPAESRDLVAVQAAGGSPDDALALARELLKDEG